MRKFLIPLLLASAAASPTIAGPRDWSNNDQQTREDRQQVREERQQAREERQQALEDRSVERPSFTGRQMQPQAQQFGGRPDFNGDARFERQQQVDGNAMRAQREVRMQQMQQQIQQQQQGEDIDQVRQRFEQRRQIQQRFDGQRGMRDGDFRQSTREVPQVMRDRHPLVVSDTPRPGTQPPLRADAARRLQEMHWNRDWRNDHHHDWRRFRDHHRSRFHFGFYFDPFGWGYQSFNIGYRLWPAYYGNRYWMDSSYYGLPSPPPGTVWVRYFNDALLVDTYTGTVIDVIPGFFW